MTRTAISPRLAMRTLVSTAIWLLACRADVPDQRSRAAPGVGFADVRWVGRDGLDQRRRHGAGPPGRARGHRARRRPPDRRPRPRRAHVDGAAGRGAAAVGPAAPAGRRSSTSRRWRSRSSAAAAVESVAGFAPRLKWPNDLVWPGDGSAPDRKLAGILAEADWPAASSISAGWKAPAAARAGRRRRGHRPQRGLAGRRCRDELADIAVAINHVVDTPGRPRGPADRAARRSSARATTRSCAGDRDRRCSTSGAPARPRSAAGCASTSAPTTSRAPPSTSPTTATWWSRRSRAKRRTLRGRRRRPPPPRLRHAGATRHRSGGEEERDGEEVEGRVGHHARSEAAGPARPPGEDAPRRGGRHEEQHVLVQAELGVDVGQPEER